MRTVRFHCPLCEWYEESNYGHVKLANVEAIISEHLATHSTLEWLQKVSRLQSELDQLKSTFP